MYVYVVDQDEAMKSLLASSNCDSSWRNSFAPTTETSDMMRISIGEFIAQHSEALGSLDGDKTVARVSRREIKLV